MGNRLTRSLAVLILVAGCTGETSPPATTAPPLSTTLTSPAAPVSPRCSATEVLGEGGVVADLESPGSDSAVISSITWSVLSGCEIFEIGFVSVEEAPSTTPPTVEALYLDPAPVIRVSLEVAASTIREQLVDSGFVDRIYVVRGLDGRLHLDLHMKGPVKARVTQGGSPATLTLELQRGIVAQPLRPALTDDLVLLTPMDGGVGVSPVTVAGYTRDHDTGVVVIATTGDIVLGEHQIQPAPDLRMWTEFRTELALDTGPVNIFAGERPPGGSLDGVTITLTVR
ncbi:MAG: hypothetical protein L0Z47_03260 [Actinobacteria bacterium]|nr:hypothetical protein [Actinomycetota bacterium]